MKFLGCLIFLLFGFVFILIAFFGNILKLFYKLHKANKQFKKAAENAGKGQFGEQQKYTETSRDSSGVHHHKKQEGEKIFSKNEGEYVDFEEIKD